jgi:hypothetical protein
LLHSNVRGVCEHQPAMPLGDPEPIRLQ